MQLTQNNAVPWNVSSQAALFIKHLLYVLHKNPQIQKMSEKFQVTFNGGKNPEYGATNCLGFIVVIRWLIKANGFAGFDPGATEW